MSIVAPFHLPSVVVKTILSLETKTETWVFRCRDLRPGQNELQCTRVSRPWSRDNNTDCINSNWRQSTRLKVLQITVIVLQA